MKRYVKASFDSSIPDWIRKRISGKWGGSAFGRNLSQKYGVKLDQVKFLDHDPGTPTSVPVYLLQTDYGQEVYCPGVNDGDDTFINGRNRRLGSIAKSKLPDMAADIVWIETADTNSKLESKDRYRDPRYTYRYDSKKGSYAGQYRRSGDTWSETGMLPANERYPRDKSGYVVPRPSERIAQYYKKFSGNITKRIDSLYERIQSVKQMLADADFNTRPDDSYENTYSRVYTNMGDAIQDYRRLLGTLDETGNFRKNEYTGEYDYSRVAQLIRNINAELDEVVNFLQ